MHCYITFNLLSCCLRKATKKSEQSDLRIPKYCSLMNIIIAIFCSSDLHFSSLKSLPAEKGYSLSLRFILMLVWDGEWHPWCFVWPLLLANASSCCEGCLALKWFITQWVKAMLSGLVLHYFVWKYHQDFLVRTMFLPWLPPVQYKYIIARWSIQPDLVWIHRFWWVFLYLIFLQSPVL